MCCAPLRLCRVGGLGRAGCTRHSDAPQRTLPCHTLRCARAVVPTRCAPRPPPPPPSALADTFDSRLYLLADVDQGGTLQAAACSNDACGALPSLTVRRALGRAGSGSSERFPAGAGRHLCARCAAEARVVGVPSRPTNGVHVAQQLTPPLARCAPPAPPLLLQAPLKAGVGYAFVVDGVAGASGHYSIRRVGLGCGARGREGGTAARIWRAAWRALHAGQQSQSRFNFTMRLCSTWHTLTPRCRLQHHRRRGGGVRRAAARQPAAGPGHRRFSGPCRRRRRWGRDAAL